MKAKIIRPNGFTLIETLVAISILLIGVLGPLSIATRGITDGFYAQNQIVATYLAQEGLEMLAARLEENGRLNPDNPELWIPSLTSSSDLVFCRQTTGCGLSIQKSGVGQIEDSLSFTDCGPQALVDGSCNRAYNSNTGFYDSWGQSELVPPSPPTSEYVLPIFRRVLRIEIVGWDVDLPTLPTQALLTSTVSWSNKGVYPPEKSFTLSLYAHNRKAF